MPVAPGVGSVRIGSCDLALRPRPSRRGQVQARPPRPAPPWGRSCRGGRKRAKPPVYIRILRPRPLRSWDIGKHGEALVVNIYSIFVLVASAALVASSGCPGILPGLGS